MSGLFSSMVIAFAITTGIGNQTIMNPSADLYANVKPMPNGPDQAKLPAFRPELNGYFDNHVTISEAPPELQRFFLGP